MPLFQTSGCFLHIQAHFKMYWDYLYLLIPRIKERTVLERSLFIPAVCVISPASFLRISTNMMDENMKKVHFYAGMIVPTYVSLLKSCRQTYSDAFTTAAAAPHWIVFLTGATVLEVELHTVSDCISFFFGKQYMSKSFIKVNNTFNPPVLWKITVRSQLERSWLLTVQLTTHLNPYISKSLFPTF